MVSAGVNTLMQYTMEQRLFLKRLTTSILVSCNSIQNQTASIYAIRQDQFVIVGTTGVNDERGVVKGFLRAISLEPGKQVVLSYGK